MSDISLLWLFVLQFVFIFLNAIFASAEIAVITINDNKLERLSQSGDVRAKRLKKLTENSSDFLATIQIGITLVNLLSSAVATENFSSRLVNLLSRIGVEIPIAILNLTSLIVITLLLTFFTVVLGELVPKQLALRSPEKVALFLSGLVTLISKIFTPVVRLFSLSTKGILRIFGISSEDDESEDTEEEIRLMLDIGAQKGQIQPDEEHMIQNIFEFDDTQIEAIMTHRTSVVFLWMDDTEEDWESTIRAGRHSVYPVCSESTDNIVGILYTKDYFRVDDKRISYLRNEVIRPVNYVLETVRADVLFRNMKQTKDRFAVVIDEYGGTSGIITMNDLLEQIVGEFSDDILMSNETLNIKPLNQHSWLVSGNTSIEELNRKLLLKIPVDQYKNLNDFYLSNKEFIEKQSTQLFTEQGFIMKNIHIENDRLKNAIIVLSK
ncbi:CNNM domain-containing protein [Marinilactibacillus sp. Marseille-P9653]|uniref:CNNM domain-containing protein n=1 Tax=Marinilactibacillus sp. Marseille-P9653 TaxID=2866583 RepID=UPI001CE46B5B|nr:CNNM domain-containing protein [Marinilactibacillus sp. Marseille-P9653]